MKPGFTVQFNASRITHGNPVKGTFLWQDDEWIAVKLSHDLEGLVNTWYEGEEKVFRKSLINGKIKVIGVK
jgi:hypothetical protein